MDRVEPRALDESFQIDEMILDYLVCLAARSIIRERAAERNKGQCSQNSEELLGIFDVFFSLFTTKYPRRELSSDLRIKLQLLTFANIFLRRHQVSQHLPSRKTLQIQRAKNKERARLWLERSGLSTSGELNIPSGGSSFPQNRNDMLRHLGLSSSDDVRDLEAQASLLDVLPEYMELSFMVPKELQGPWMENAVRLMLQSALEQVFIYGQVKLNQLNQAFAWDWEAPTAAPEELNKWITLRESARRSFMGAGASDCLDNMKRLSFKDPLFDFEGCVLEQLRRLLEMLPAPVLQQLESGTLSGLTKPQMEAFRSRIGIR